MHYYMIQFDGEQGHSDTARNLDELVTRARRMVQAGHARQAVVFDPQDDEVVRVEVARGKDPTFPWLRRIEEAWADPRGPRTGALEALTSERWDEFWSRVL